MSDRPSFAEQVWNRASEMRVSISSPYLRGDAISAMDRWQCCYCGRPLIREGRPFITDPRQKTRDHVLPKHVGTQDLGWHHYTTRPCCRRCNQLRARVGHCVGCLMLAIIEARHQHKDVEEMAGVLGLRA